METFGPYISLVAPGLQVLGFLVLAGLALARIGQRWAVLALLGALLSIVPILWYAAATAAVQLGDGGIDVLDFFYAPAASLLMQSLGLAGLALVVAAVVVGRGPRKEAPAAEGPTGTTYRQLPSGVRWE